MTGKHSPRGLWIVAALALLLGVGLQSPVWAGSPGDNNDGTGFFSDPRGGPGGGPGDPGSGRSGESDPDWWQTDVWSGTEVGALPAQDSPRAQESRGFLRLVEDTVRRIMTWLQLVGGHHLGF